MLNKIRKFLIGGKENLQSPQRAATASWETIQDNLCLVITFNGVFTHTDAEALTRDLHRQIADFPATKKFPLICRCYYMTDYEAHARLIFQDFLETHKLRIQSVWIITASKVIKYGGKLLKMFSSIPIHVIEREDDIQLLS